MSQTEQPLPAHRATTVSRYWLIAVALVVTTTATVLGTLYVRSRPQLADATAVLAISARPAYPSADPVLQGAPKYVALATSSATIDALAAYVGEEPGKLRQTLNIVRVPNTSNLKVSVPGLDPERAVAVANGLALQLARRAERDQTFDVQVLTLAEPPRPTRRFVEALVVAAAIALGAIAATGVEATRRTLRALRGALAAADLSIPPGYQLLGVVPRLRASAQREPLLTDIELADPEALRAGGEITENIARKMGGETRGMIVVICPAGNQDTSTTAKLLAASLNHDNSSLLLVDLHPGKGSVEQWTGGPPRGGPHQPRDGLPAGSGDFQDWMGQVWLIRQGLCLLPAGERITDQEPELDALTAILREARELFDTVIVDSPWSPPSRAQQLASLADSLVIVMPLGKMNGHVEQALDTLRGFSPPRSRGVVMSGNL